MKVTLRSWVAFGAAVFGLAAQAANYTLDLREESAAEARGAQKVRILNSVQKEEGVLRRVHLDAGRTAVDALQVGDELELALFDDVTLGLTLVERTLAPLGGASFLANVAGYEDVCNAVVHQNAEGLQVDVQSFKTKKVYTIYSTAEGVTIKELEASGKAQHCEEMKVPVKANVSAAKVPRLMNEVKSAAGSQAVAYVDILIVYDALAADWVATNGGVTNFAEVSIQKMNTAIANTGLDEKFRFRLVGVKTIAGQGKMDEGASLNKILNAMVGKYLKKSTVWNGYDWGGMPTMRDAVGADIVCVLTDTGSEYGITGSGFSLESDDRPAEFADYAYSCCSIRSVAQSHTLTHEAGHNMGAGHSDQVADVSNRGPQYYEYSSGYYFYVGETGYHTIMAYNDDGYGNNYDAVPYFSSPDYTFEGVVVGNATHDNSRTLANNFAAVAAFRAAKYVDGQGVIEVVEPITFSEATVFNGYLKTGEGEFAGTLQVKVAKANTRTKVSKLTATLELVGQKKKSLRGEFQEGVATFTNEEGLNLNLTLDEMVGTYGMYTIVGAKDIFSSNDKADKAEAASLINTFKARGAVAMAWQNDLASQGWNYLTMTVGSKGKTKIAGVLADGTKVSATTTMIVKGTEGFLPIALTKQGLTFFVTLDVEDAANLAVEGPVLEPVMGYGGGLSEGGEYSMNADAIVALLGDGVLTSYLPMTMSITVKGTRWNLPTAGKVVLKNGEVDETKLKENPSGLKLTYKSNGGTFTGSFKAYTLSGKRVKATTVSIVGVMIEGKGYGAAYIKKKGSAAVTIE